LEHYAVGKMLGKGAFGKVNVGVHKLTEELTAMKLCERKLISHSQAKKCLMQEVNILRRVNGHANIIQLLEVIETDTALVLVMEFAASGDLLRYVRQHRKLAEDCAQGLFKQLLDGLDHIHRMAVVHRDIKLENLLLDSFGCLKIADFGVATLLKCPEQRLDDHCGTPSYIAPEVLLDSGYQGPPVDMWSAGIVLYAMLIGHAPFKADQLLDLRRCILRGRYHTPPHLSEEAANLLRRLLVVAQGWPLAESNNGIHRITLTFRERGTEKGFSGNRTGRLATAMFCSCFVVLVCSICEFESVFLF